MYNNGCFEVMSDKHTRYSHVRVIENSPARILVHWRTALPNAHYRFTKIDPMTGWAPWGDDYYYIYPDGVCVRYQRVWGKGIHEFQQSEVLCQPGTKPMDNIEEEAITVMDMNGNTNTYSWKKAYGERLPTDKEVNGPIQIINLKSRNRHYVIGEEGSKFKPFTFGARDGYTNFPNWNHWPVAQLPNDGRVAPAPDRPSHACPGTLYPIRHKDKEGNSWVRNLYGMTDNNPNQLAVLARSWNNPPPLKLQDGAFTNQGYDKSQRAYLLTNTSSGKPESLTFEIAASEESPIANLALVIENWGDDNAILMFNGKLLELGNDFQIGYRRRLKGVDLIVWIKKESVKPVKIRLDIKES